jgi:hypothetical protein
MAMQRDILTAEEPLLELGNDRPNYSIVVSILKDDTTETGNRTVRIRIL